jgi:hypothetical protein
VEPLGGLALVLVVFMLIGREDLRDRVISLVGHGRLTLTTAAHVRLLCTRLHARFPDLKILVGRWGFEHAEGHTPDPLLAAGAYLVATSLEETRNQVAILAEIDAPSTRPAAAPAPQAASALRAAPA